MCRLVFYFRLKGPRRLAPFTVGPADASVGSIRNRLMCVFPEIRYPMLVRDEKRKRITASFLAPYRYGVSPKKTAHTHTSFVLIPFFRARFRSVSAVHLRRFLVGRKNVYCKNLPRRRPGATVRTNRTRYWHIPYIIVRVYIYTRIASYGRRRPRALLKFSLRRIRRSYVRSGLRCIFAVAALPSYDLRRPDTRTRVSYFLFPTHTRETKNKQ